MVWDDENIGKPAYASAEAARYYSVKEYLKHGTPRVCKHPQPQPDSRFADFDNILLHSDIQPLQDSIERFADFPIATIEQSYRIIIYFLS